MNKRALFKFSSLQRPHHPIGFANKTEEILKKKNQGKKTTTQPPKTPEDHHPKPPYSGEVYRNHHSFICFKGLGVFMFIVFFGF
jgi:hypothetical protein